jgi:hypothetical protein
LIGSPHVHRVTIPIGHNVIARYLERLPNRLALDPLHIIAEPEGRKLGPGWSHRRVNRYGVETDRAAHRQHDRALDGVLELSHVPRPVVRLKQFDDAPSTASMCLPL